MVTVQIGLGSLSRLSPGDAARVAEPAFTRRLGARLDAVDGAWTLTVEGTETDVEAAVTAVVGRLVRLRAAREPHAVRHTWPPALRSRTSEPEASAMASLS